MMVTNFTFVNYFSLDQQECIPVGCVPSATVAVYGGVPGLGVGVGCTWYRGRGVPGPGGYLVPGGTCPGTTPPSCGEPHACENITFATSLRTVIKQDVRYLVCCRMNGIF